MYPERTKKMLAKSANHTRAGRLRRAVRVLRAHSCRKSSATPRTEIRRTASVSKSTLRMVSAVTLTP